MAKKAAVVESDDPSKGRKPPPAKKVKSARTKDKNAPKRGNNGYMFFSQKARLDVVAENPNLKQSEVLKAVGAKWQRLTAEEKAPYEKMAADDKVRYAKEKEAYDRKKASEPQSDAEDN
eukprot:GHVH01013773.1.p1 GENE.GHVH01013773.1~~GHVH01013773.1.p1  ORF type:complete len:119 (-),score=23.55 GHVH01013773.1:50-406(-)